MDSFSSTDLFIKGEKIIIKPLFYINFAFLVVFILFSIYLQYILMKKKNIFPYQNINPIWQICNVFILIFYLIINHVHYSLKQFHVNIMEYDTLENSLTIMTSIFMHYIFLILNLSRGFYFMKVLRYHKGELSNLQINSSNYEKRVMEFKEYYSNSQDTMVFAKTCYACLGIILFFLILCIFSPTRCFMMNMTCFNLYICGDCGNETFSIQLKMTAIILGIILFFVETIIFLVLMYRIYYHSYKIDIFDMKTEIIGVFLMWFGNHFTNLTLSVFWYPGPLKRNNLKSGSPMDDNWNCFYEIATSFLYLIFYYYLIRKRDKLESHELLKKIKDRDYFLKDTLCLIFFKEYIEDKHTNDKKYFDFWIEMKSLEVKIDNIIKEIEKSQSNNKLINEKEINRSEDSPKKDKIESFDKNGISNLLSIDVTRKLSTEYNSNCKNYKDHLKCCFNIPKSLEIRKNQDFYIDSNMEVIDNNSAITEYRISHLEMFDSCYGKDIKKCLSKKIDKIKDKALKIFQKYIDNDHSSKSSTLYIDTQNGNFYFKPDCIHFPTDIRNSIKEYFFNFNNINLSTVEEILKVKEIFIDCKSHVKTKLDELFFYLRKDNEAYKKLTNLFLLF